MGRVVFDKPPKFQQVALKVLRFFADQSRFESCRPGGFSLPLLLNREAAEAGHRRICGSVVESHEEIAQPQARKRGLNIRHAPASTPPL